MKYVHYGALAYLVIVNLVGFVSMWNDKRKAKLGKWRTPEHELIMIAVLGGSVGALLGMKKFRHKTKHVKFYVGIPVILGIQIMLIVSVVLLYSSISVKY